MNIYKEYLTTISGDAEDFGFMSMCRGAGSSDHVVLRTDIEN